MAAPDAFGNAASGLRFPAGGEEAQSLLKAIRRITHAIDVRSRAVAQITGLTIPQLVVLKAVAELGEVTTNALAAHADLRPATIVTILANLEEKRLVERVRSRLDRRIVHTRLTADGQARLDAGTPLLPETFADRFAALSERRRRTIIAALTEVADLLDGTSAKTLARVRAAAWDAPLAPPSTFDPSDD